MHPLSGRSYLLDNDERLAVVRLGSIDYRDGKAVKRGDRAFKIWATVQPAGARDLQLVPEGDRYKGVLNLWQPKNPGEGVLQTDDKVLREGLLWHVHSADDWGSYVEARLVRIDTPDDKLSEAMLEQVEGLGLTDELRVCLEAPRLP